MKYVILLTIAFLSVIAPPACAADVSITVEGTYSYYGATRYFWHGGTPVGVSATSHYGDNNENYWCREQSYVETDAYGGASWASSQVFDRSCDTNPNPSSVSAQLVLQNGDFVHCRGYTMDCAICDPGNSNNIATTVTFSSEAVYTVSGATDCLDYVALYIWDGGDYRPHNYTTLGSYYSFPIFDNNDYRLIFSNGVYYDFTCGGNEVFDYDGCIWVYGYTCGVDSIRLYIDDSGWVLDEVEAQNVSYDIYEIQIADGVDYLISFVSNGFVVGNQTFSCAGSDVHIDHDRCQWVYPPSPWDTPYIIYLWAGYDYNVVVFKDVHGNFIENGQLAIYDRTSDKFVQKWTDTTDGYALLGARFDTDHDVQLLLRTFDGMFTLDTTYPANGTAEVGEEDIVTTNWTIPIMYNLGLQPVDQTGKPVFDVFCGLSEYTPLNPQSFWGMDLSARGYVPVTNCSGFAMCDIVAEKDGYADYNVSMINWTSRSAMVKDYRHDIVMEVE